MSNISFTEITDGSNIDASDVNGPLNTIYDDYNGGIDSNNLADNAVTTAKITDAQITNAKLSTTAGEIGGAWKDWVPTWNNFTKGSATIVAKYTQIGKTVHFVLVVTLAADSSMGSDPTFSLPVTAATGYGILQPIGLLHIKDANGVNNEGAIGFKTTDTASLLVYNASGTYIAYNSLTNTVPMTWTTSDYFSGTGTYEAA